MKKKRELFPYLMILPASACIAAICLYPVFTGIALSFTGTSLMNPKVMDFVGLQNFAEIAGDSEFWGALGFTLVFTLSTVALSYLLGLGCALLMNRKVRCRSLVRALLLMPWVVPAVVGTTAWTWILSDQTGFVNLFLKNIGAIRAPILFLGSAGLARVTVILFSCWKAFPFMSIVLLSSLQAIPGELYEAGQIDGASAGQGFFYITLPLIRRESLLAVLLQCMWTFNNFDNIYLLTKGGPAQATQVMSIYSYNTAFYRSSLGYASAVSVVMMLFMVALCALYFRLSRNAEG